MLVPHRAISSENRRRVTRSLFFAAAKVLLLRIFCLKNDWRELGPLMRSIGERLIGSFTAGAPEAGFTCLAFYCVRRVLGAD